MTDDGADCNTWDPRRRGWMTFGTETNVGRSVLQAGGSMDPVNGLEPVHYSS
jgi:hypothetical protein